MKQKEFLGIDIGASGIKGAIVDVDKGELITERFRLPTPQPSKPKEVAKVFTEIVRHFGWSGKMIGCGFPSVIKHSVAYTASNIDDSWIGTNVAETFSDYSGCPVTVRNDAGMAGIAEMEFGVGKGVSGTVIIITIGSGLGSALFADGVLVQNTEFGHIYLKGHNKIAEQYASDGARKRKELSWTVWGKRFNQYLEHIEFILSPELIVLGGGTSKRFEKFEKYIKVKTPVIPAVLLNNAGIIGAAVHVSKKEAQVKKVTKTLS